MGLQPTSGLVCVCSETLWYAVICPMQGHPLDTRREPSALQGWILDVIDFDPKGSSIFLRILSAEGQSVRPCWTKSKLQGHE